jgi:hypothetical protein
MRYWCPRCNLTIYERRFTKKAHALYIKEVSEELRLAAAGKDGLTYEKILAAKKMLDDSERLL